jgi:hypothetical protein
MFIGHHVQYRYSRQILMKLEFSRHIFGGKKSSDIKCNENPSSGSRVVPRGRTDRRDEANSPFSYFFERAKKTSRNVFALI